MESASFQRLESTQNLINELEKRVFEVEKERIRLRREREDTDREVKRLQAGRDRTDVNQELLQMIHANQTRLADANANLTQLIQRQEHEAQEREIVWTLQVKEIKGLLSFK